MLNDLYLAKFPTDVSGVGSGPYTIFKVRHFLNDFLSNILDTIFKPWMFNFVGDKQQNVHLQYEYTVMPLKGYSVNINE